MSRQQWKIASCDKDRAAKLAEACDLDALAALLLVARGVDTPEAVHAFLDEPDCWCDPFRLPDMEPAVARIRKAIDGFERIAVYGDYDADGVTATALLYSYLEMQGADVFSYIPQRETEGYGLHRDALDALKERGAQLIVTVDNGISAMEEAAYAAALGLDLVITDHHRVGDTLPQAVAVVDPHRPDCTCPFQDWAGVGVAFLLVRALEGGGDELLEYFSDMITIGTIADVVPLRGENRALVRRGLMQINQGGHPGILALREVAGLDGRELTASHVAFGLAPRINAAGRMGSADRALRLLLCEDLEDARPLAREIDEANQERQRIEKEILAEARAQLSAAPDRCYDRVLVVAGAGWHDGVLGIVASQLKEQYGRPCIVLSVRDGKAKGSGRSVEGFSLYDALKACAPHLHHFGGHTLAAGLELDADQIDAFCAAVNAYAAQQEMPVPQLLLDCKLNPAYLNLDTLDTLSRLEPFGAGNPQPLFGLYRMRLEEVRPVGNGKHLRLTLSRNGAQVTAMRFGVTAAQFPFRLGDVVDLAVQVERNEFRGQAQVSIRVREIRPSGGDEDALFRAIHIYETVRRREPLDAPALELAVPPREAMAAVFRFLRANAPWRYGEELLCSRLGSVYNVCMVSLALDVLEEMGLTQRDETGAVVLRPGAGKVSLDDSRILQKLRGQKEQVTPHV